VPAAAHFHIFPVSNTLPMLDSMLSLEQCWAIDPALESLSDEELISIVALLTKLAELALQDQRAGEDSKHPRGFLNASSASCRIEG
jgi:hypothetical protein